MEEFSSHIFLFFYFWLSSVAVVSALALGFLPSGVHSQCSIRPAPSNLILSDSSCLRLAHYVGFTHPRSTTSPLFGIFSIPRRRSELSSRAVWLALSKLLQRSLGDVTSADLATRYYFLSRAKLVVCACGSVTFVAGLILLFRGSRPVHVPFLSLSHFIFA